MILVYPGAICSACDVALTERELTNSLFFVEFIDQRRQLFGSKQFAHFFFGFTGRCSKKSFSWRNVLSHAALGQNGGTIADPDAAADTRLAPDSDFIANGAHA